jgi:ribosomal-protein-alanine N-acetyltransferase
MNPPRDPKPKIRKMTLAHLDAVVQIEKQLFSDPWSRRSFQFEILANQYSLPLVLLLDKNLIGYGIVWIIFGEFHIANLAIHPDYQQKGFGSYLLKEILKKAVGLDYAILEVRESNLKAIRLYEKFGFERIAVRRHYYSNGDDAIIMRRWFKPPKQVESDADVSSKQKSLKS